MDIEVNNKQESADWDLSEPLGSIMSDWLSNISLLKKLLLYMDFHLTKHVLSEIRQEFQDTKIKISSDLTVLFL
jgi:hypothetical protein